MAKKDQEMKSERFQVYLDTKASNSIRKLNEKLCGNTRSTFTVALSLLDFLTNEVLDGAHLYLKKPDEEQGRLIIPSLELVRARHKE